MLPLAPVHQSVAAEYTPTNFAARPVHVEPIQPVCSLPRLSTASRR